MPRISRTFRVRSSVLSTPNAQAILWCVPNRLVTIGIVKPSTLRKYNAGPPDLTARSVISVISRSLLTGASI